MTKHRMLSIKKLVGTVDWDLFKRYFEQLAPASRPDDWAFLNAPMMEEFLANPENEAATPVIEDFNRINDLCGRGASLLFRAYEEYGIDCDSDERPLVLSMRLFLDHRAAFEYAWTLYLLVGQRASMCEHHFPAGELAQVSTEDEAILRASFQSWFQQHKEGQHCELRVFRDHESILIRISRGAVIRTVARWQENRISFESFRPVREDVIVYEPSRSCLSIRTRLRRDREFYVHQFAEHVAHRPELAELALKTKVWSLEPFQNDTFDYRGDGVITSIALIEIQVKLNEETLILRSPRSLQPSLGSEINGIPIRAGDWLKVGLRFALSMESRRKPQHVVVHIEPPGYSDLKQKVQGDLIETYLRREQVKRI